MAYTKEQIERYLEILHNFSANQAEGDEDGDRIAKVIVSLLNQVTISVNPVV